MKLRYSGTDEGFIHKNRTITLVKPYQAVNTVDAHSNISNTGGNLRTLTFTITGNSDEFFRSVF